MTHDHNCFLEALNTTEKMLKEGGPDARVGFFLYVGNDRTDDAHFKGNTAFAAGVLQRLIRDVLSGHEYGKCGHCDRVAAALEASGTIFRQMMFGAPGRC